MLELLWQSRIAYSIRVKIDDVDLAALLHFALAKIVQIRSPLAILLQIIGDVLGEQNVSGIAAIHHPLGNVDSGARNVRSLGHIRDFAYRAAMNSHPHFQFWMRF